MRFAGESSARNPGAALIGLRKRWKRVDGHGQEQLLVRPQRRPHRASQQRNEPQEFADEADEGGVHEKDVMPCRSYSAVGNMNLHGCAPRAPHTPAVHPPCLRPSPSPAQHARREHPLARLLQGSVRLKTFEEVVDQIYYDCKMCCMDARHAQGAARGGHVSGCAASATPGTLRPRCSSSSSTRCSSPRSKSDVSTTPTRLHQGARLPVPAPRVRPQAAVGVVRATRQRRDPLSEQETTTTLGGWSASAA